MKHVAGGLKWGRFLVVLAGAATIGIADVVRGEPLPAVLAQTTVDGDAAARADAAAAALVDRLFKQPIDAQQRAEAIEAVLSYQGDASKPWTTAWAELLGRVQTERVKLGGGLTPAQEERIINQAVRPVAVARPTAMRGRFLPIDIEPGTVRLAAGKSVTAMIAVRDWRIETEEKPKGVMLADAHAGRDVSGKPDPLADGRANSDAVWDIASPAAKKAAGGGLELPWPDMGMRSPIRTGVYLPATLPRGQATIRAEVDVVSQSSESSGTMTQTSYVGVVRTIENVRPGTVTLAIPIKIVEKAEEIIEARMLAGDELAKFTAALKPDNVTVTVTEVFAGGNARIGENGERIVLRPEERGKRSLLVQVYLGGLFPERMTVRGEATNRKVPEGAAFDVRVIVDDQDAVVGTLAPTDEDGQRVALLSQFGKTRLRVPKGRVATVRLVPSRKVAEGCAHATWYHDGVIEFKDVPVIVKDRRSQKLEPLEGLADTTRAASPMPDPAAPPIPFRNPAGE